MKKVIGIGNALVDVLVRLQNDDILSKFNLAKGSMQLSEMELVEKIEKETEGLDKSIASGGSCANTIHALAKLGVETAYVGKVSDDAFGKFFADDLKKVGVDPKLIAGETSTGRALTLISKDSERTFATFLGAAAEMIPDELTSDIFKGYDYLYVEGYLLFNHELLLKALDLGKKSGAKICLDLASFNVVEANLDFLKKIIPEYVDIVFSNEEEAEAYTGKSPEETLDILSNQCEIAIVKLGKKGSLVKRGNESVVVDCVEADAVDTTGAGDLYAAGFMYGLIKNLSLLESGRCGAIVSAKIVEYVGAKIDNDGWMDIMDIIG